MIPERTKSRSLILKLQCIYECECRAWLPIKISPALTAITLEWVLSLTDSTSKLISSWQDKATGLFFSLILTLFLVLSVFFTHTARMWWYQMNSAHVEFNFETEPFNSSLTFRLTRPNDKNHENFNENWIDDLWCHQNDNLMVFCIYTNTQIHTNILISFWNAMEMCCCCVFHGIHLECMIFGLNALVRTFASRMKSNLDVQLYIIIMNVFLMPFYVVRFTGNFRMSWKVYISIIHDKMKWPACVCVCVLEHSTDCRTWCAYDLSKFHILVVLMHIVCVCFFVFYSFVFRALLHCVFIAKRRKWLSSMNLMSFLREHLYWKELQAYFRIK